MSEIKLIDKEKIPQHIAIIGWEWKVGRKKTISHKNGVNIVKLIVETASETGIKYLSAANIPDPELLIRTGGEYRISNFLLWKIAYTEFYFTKTLCPDFDKKDYTKLFLIIKREKKDVKKQVNS